LAQPDVPVSDAVLDTVDAPWIAGGEDGDLKMVGGESPVDLMGALGPTAGTGHERILEAQMQNAYGPGVLAGPGRKVWLR
jgi:hypothetical protein